MVASIASFLDVCRFNPTTGGTTDWTFSSAVNGYQSPSSAGVVNSATYRYRAESADLTQWEIGTGVYNTGTGVLTRATVLYNSSATGTGSGQSGAGTKINFTLTPQVAIVALREDFLALTTGQIPGTTTNDDASAGNVGEYLTASFSSASAPTGSISNLGSISLTAGDWDVTGYANFFQNTGTSTVAYMDVSLSTTSAVEGTAKTSFFAGNITYFTTINGGGFFVSPMVTRFSLSTTTTVFFVVHASYSSGTVVASGIIRARRVR